METLSLLLSGAVDLAKRVAEKHLISPHANPIEGSALPRLLDQHLNHIAKWSSLIQFVGTGRPLDVDAESIALDYSHTARQFRNKGDNGEIIDETALLESEVSYLLIGDPGSGKTTTLKRVARKLLLSEGTEDDLYQFPILIRFKEIDEIESIHALIATTIGFQVEKKEFTREIERKVPRLDTNGNAILDSRGKQTYKKIKEEESYYVSQIDNQDIDSFIARFLNNKRAVVLLDGLDELDTRFLDVAIVSLNKLVGSLSDAKVILTCRAGQFQELKKCEGFALMSILPLTDSQIEVLARSWLANADPFVKELHELPYRDLADRPLLLTQLLLIYRRFGTLPKQPKDVYQLIVELLLKEWDAEQSVVRHSAYAGFNVRKKAEYLAELSFRLMYIDRKLEFDTEDLIHINRLMHYKFDLPLDESREVAEEIETHTGIIVSAGYQRYEFSHVSLHEYLCADYIVRSPFTLETKTLLESHPEPVAIAIALASNPTSWFVSLVMNDDIRDALIGKALNPFLTRLILERPGFSISEELGFVILNLFYSSFSRAGIEGRALFNKLFQVRGIRESVQRLLKDRHAVTIVREKPRSHRVKVTYLLPLNPATGKPYSKTMLTTVGVLKEFFSAFEVTLRTSDILPNR